MKTSFIAIALALFSVKSFALTNSQVAETPEWTNVMQISSEAPDAKGDTTPGYCNATLIHKNVLITAAHCLKLAYVSGMKKIKIEVGEYKYVIRKTDGVKVRVGYVPKFVIQKNVNIELPQSLVDKIRRSGFKTNIGPNEDVAIAWWSDEVPEFKDIEVAAIATQQDHALLVKSLPMATLQAVTINPFNVSTTDTKRMATLDNAKWNGYVHSKSTARVEEGDSGAPLFAMMNGKLKVFAVVKGRAATVFDNWDAYSAIHPHLCMMAKTLPTFIKFNTCN